MDFSDKNHDAERLYTIGEQTARLNRQTGAMPVSVLISALDTAMGGINSAYERISSRFGSSAGIPPACEWLLDNRYIAVREAKGAKAALSSVKQLRCSENGIILYELCRGLVKCRSGAACEESCLAFLDGFQSVTVLPGRELELFPAVMRIALLERLSSLCDTLLGTAKPEELTDGLAEVFTSLRFFGGLDARQLIENADQCEKLLLSDPAGVYPQMDEVSRAYYRERLCELAEANSMEEHKLARHIISQCRKAEGNARHVGYHLFVKPCGRQAVSRKGTYYIAANVVFTLFLSVLCGFLSHSLAAALLLLLPVSELTKSLLDHIILLCIKPRRLPRLEYKDGIPESARTVCVISSLINGRDSAQRLCRRMEELMLLSRGCGENLMFGILADLPEADSAVTEDDASVISAACNAVTALNKKYGGGFFLFTRQRVEDRGRKKFSGFERKRGALLALAALLGGEESELTVSVGDAERLRGAKYILTLDSDTVPSPDSLAELIGAIEHPLNKPVLDRERGCVISGHAVIHPRMSCELSGAGASDFSRIFAGRGGLEPYSVLCGELYMDLYDRGGFSGKGIIDAEALYLCSKKHLPEGLVLSHDALEGAYLRGAYMSDTEFSDSFPSSPIAYYRRLHRWTRGDWQNSGWIFSRSRAFPDIERFKLFDSLRRSLVAPLTFAAVFLGLLIPERGLIAAAWVSFLALAVRLLIALTESGTARSCDSRTKYHSRLTGSVKSAFLQTVLRLLLLPYEAWICISAALTSLWRMCVSGRNLLEWETADQAELKKRSLANYYRNMWFSAAAGAALLVAAPSVAGKLAGLLWLLSPILAIALSLPPKAAKELSDSDREYLRGCAGSIWAYFEKFCSAEDNYLPPDNYQEQPPVGIAHRTSPTNIGFALVSAMCAVDLGIDGSGKAFELISGMLSTLEKMPRFYGHFCNWYDTRTLRCLEPAYISTVDSGNLYASLLTLREGLREHGRTELSLRVNALMEPMDFSVLYDSGRRLFHIGMDVESSTLSPNYYDLYASEARLTSYLAIAKGDVPRSHWRRLSRAMRSYSGFKGMASWTGTMFEYLMPELFLPLCPDSLMYETAKYCMLVQKHRRSPTGVWGISESAFFSLDPALNYRYKAHGCKQLALKRGQERELVISPYSSFLALCTEPNAAVKNLQRLEKSGAVGRFGFIEAIDFSPSRCRNENGEQVRCYMAHHLGMSMLAITNCIADGLVRRRFMSAPCMSAHRGLLEEKLPVNAPVLKLGDGDTELSRSRAYERQWTKRGEDTDFEDPHCMLLSNGMYNIILTESGASLATCGEMLIARPVGTAPGEGHGTELRLICGERSFSFLPEPASDLGYMWEFGEISYSCTGSDEGMTLKTVIAAAGSENGELRFAEIDAKRDIKDAQLVLSFEPALAGYDDYLNHPSYWRLGIEAHTDGNCLMLHRLARGKQREAWLCLACDRKAAFCADKYGSTGHLSYPYVTVSVPVSLAAGEHFSARFAVCVAYSPDEAYSGAQHMLAIGPSEYGMMSSACASLMSLKAHELDSAMELIRPLCLPSAKKPLPSKQTLWKYGISGDMPLIVCPQSEASPENCVSLTKQFCLLRSCGLFADMVFLANDGGEYRRPVYSAVRDTLATYGLEALLGTHGGIRILPLSAESDMLSSASAVIGSVPPERRVGASYYSTVTVPRTAGSVPKYSYDRDGSFVFCVDRSLPGRIWSHMLTNGSFGYLAADSGCGNMWYKNARELRINRWINDPHAVRGPETLEYVCKSGRYSLFADSDGVPCRVRYGFGFAVWEKSFGATGIRCTAFVPSGTDARVMIIEVCGSITGQIAWKTELQLGSSEDDRAAVSISCANSMFRAESARSPIPGLCFKALCSEPALGWTGDLFSWLRGDFDGRTEKLSVPVFSAMYNCRPVSVIVCGCCEDEKLLSLCKPENAFAALDAVKSAWRTQVQRLRLSAGLPFSNYMNGWAVYQTLACRLMGRCSVYQSGGAIGFRDQLQDAVNMLLIAPELARHQILSCCSHQYTEGDVMHWWHSLPGGDRGVRTRCSDDLLWLPWALCEYVEKTGDESVCFESVYYMSSEPLSDTESDRYETPSRSELGESVLEHAKKALDRCMSRGTGVHGLLYFGSCDWNDGMDKVGGESVWLSWFFAHTARRFSELLMLLCRHGSDEYRANAERIGTAADRAWDGTHWLRGYWADGTPLGSRESDCCRIDSIAQSWAAFCSDASNSRIDMALDTAVSELYDRENGLIKLFTPPFYASERDPGYIQSYGPGFRENGGQYTHAAIWLAMACLRRGRVKDGYSILCDILPESHSLKRYMAEPFVLAADVYTCPEHLGEAGWTWYTGSSGWYFRVVTEELLGLRLKSGILYIRPVLPEDFPECRLSLSVKNGKTHEIVISSEEITVDGEKYDGKGIPYN